jgi:glycosyltransferase involved in cell wall biosynthesis/tetratricopeptide (TPR) repeat protein
VNISLGMIVRNEGETLERCLQSIRPFVDEIVIGLAGTSTDNTEEIARKYADFVFDIPWTNHFADARNEVLSRVNGDYFMWLDGDDEVVNGDMIRYHIGRNPRIGAFFAFYDYGRDDQGNTVCQLVRERIMKRGLGFHWEGRVHEVMVTDQPHEIFLLPSVVIRHQKSEKVRGNRNLDLLYQELAETEPNPSARLLIYLGNEEAIRGNAKQALLHWQRYIRISKWNEEVYQVQHKIADILRGLGELDKAAEADLAAIRMAPDWPDAYFGLAETSIQREEWKAVVEWTKSGSTKEAPDTSLVINPLDYSYYPQITVAVAYIHLGAFEEALANLKLAFSVKQEQSVADLIYTVKHEIEQQNVYQAFMTLLSHLGRHDEWLKARKLFTVAPKLIEQHPTVMEYWEKVSQMTAHVEDESILEEFYQTNPFWSPVSDEFILEGWPGIMPRRQFAIDTALRLQPASVIDLGCSDGFITIPVARALPFADVEGVDLDPRCVEIGNRRAEQWGITNLRFTTGNFSRVAASRTQSPTFSKFDLAIFFEAIEHVVDPAATLTEIEKIAHHIAITTPYLAWDNGDRPDWDVVEIKGHLRIFDLTDLEILLAPRGRIHNLHRLKASMTQAWIAADYEVGETTDKNVQIICPFGMERWGPTKLRKEGLGGSETAAIRVAEELASFGHAVTIFCPVDEPGYFNKVRYRNPDQYHPGVKSDMVIAWRDPTLADRPPNTEKFVLWFHDAHVGTNLTPERAEQFDAIVVLTEWHKGLVLKTYPFLDSDKIVIIGNGIDFKRFDPIVQRDPKRVVYSSSPDRGLDLILEHIWPRVLKEVPDAEFHYYYGWNTTDAGAKIQPELGQLKRVIADLTIATRNVVSHGRLPQDELAIEMMKGSIWLYPTAFPESYCITAIEAQLAGLYPITDTTSALKEVVQSGTIIPGDPRDPKNLEKFTQATIDRLKNPPTDDERHDIAERAPARSWCEIAKDWERYFLQTDRRSDGIPDA